MITLELFGVEYPMVFTVAAQAEIAKRFGGIDKIGTALDSGEFQATLENISFMAAALMKGAEERERVRCLATGVPYEGKPALTAQNLMNALELQDVKRATKAVVDAIKEGSSVTVELKEEKGKNADATP